MNRIAAICVAPPDFADTLTPVQLLALRYDHALWLRPEQHLHGRDWRSITFNCGRGWGKSEAIACEINRRVQRGELLMLGLMGPNEDRVDDVMIKALIETSPPWCKAYRYRSGVRWTNSNAAAIVYTAENPDSARGQNLNAAWLCEIVGWPPNTRRLAYENITVSTRKKCHYPGGIREPQVFIDTTSRNKIDVIQILIGLNERFPEDYRWQGGETFDNPTLPRKYLRDICTQLIPGSRRYAEEIEGKVFAESPGALWEQAWLDANRRAVPPAEATLTIVGFDPAKSIDPTADESGIVVGSRDRDGDVYLLRDHTGRHKPDVAGDIIVDECLAGAAGAILELNTSGIYITEVLRSRAATKGLRVEVLDKKRPFPARRPGVIYVRELTARSDKATRAGGPASETRAGRVHVVGHLDALELEFTTFEPGGKSPNRYDAAVYVITELRGLAQETPPDAREEMRKAAALQKELRYRMNGGREAPVGVSTRRPPRRGRGLAF